jgi:small-conductance mechanosensitive channel/CRP-like cAMP-binding protein
MNFLSQLQFASGIPAFILAAPVFLVVAIVLIALRPAERMRLRAAVLLFLVGVVGLFAIATLAARGLSITSRFYLWFDWASLFFLWIAFVNVASVLFFDVLLSSLRLSPPRILRDLLLAVAYVIVGITLLSIPHVDITGLVATSAVLTAVIGLSFQDTLGNMMGGMALQMERAISVGDWIRIDNQEGMVKEIRWRHTAVETRNWDTIIFPNSALMKAHVTVLGRRTGQPRQHRQWVYFNVDFRYSPAEVIDTVEKALCVEPIANVATTPAPNCVLMDFKESYCSYAVRYWLTDMAVDDPTNSVVRTRIYFALRRANIPLSIPAQALFVTEEELSREERKRAQEIDKRARALKRVELFESLTDEERQQLASRIRIAPFARGEVMTKQGAEAHWLYIITLGDAEVRFSLEGKTEHVATLHPGDFFGERGMMTGERRSADVIALTDVECYRVDKDSFQEILHKRPEIAEDISQVLARRRAELEAAREDLTEEAKRARMRDHQGALLQRIRNFFAL